MRVLATWSSNFIPSSLSQFFAVVCINFEICILHECNIWNLLAHFRSTIYENTVSLSRLKITGTSKLCDSYLSHKQISDIENDTKIKSNEVIKPALLHFFNYPNNNTFSR